MSIQWEKKGTDLVSGQFTISKSSGRFILSHNGERLYRGSLAEAKNFAEEYGRAAGIKSKEEPRPDPTPNEGTISEAAPSVETETAERTGPVPTPEQLTTEDEAWINEKLREEEERSPLGAGGEYLSDYRRELEEKLEAERYAKDDEAIRTPDAQLDPSEREDQPEERGRSLIEVLDDEEDTADPFAPSAADPGPAPSDVARTEPPVEDEQRPDPTKSTDSTTPSSVKPVVLSGQLRLRAFELTGEPGEDEIQDTVTELFRKYGTNCPRWLEWPELLRHEGLVPSDVTPEIARRAAQTVVRDTQQEIHRIVANGHAGAGRSGEDKVSDDVTEVEVTFMQVKEADARAMFQWLGLPGVDNWNAKKLVSRLNAAADYQDKAIALPAGDDLTLYKSITDALGDGEKIELWVDDADPQAALAEVMTEPTEASESPKPSTRKVTKKVTKKAAKVVKPAKKDGKAKKASPASNGHAKPAKAGSLSGLDAAHKVLVGSDEPMTIMQIVETIFKKKLWETSGKTPGQTISAAVQREIRDKGKESRFKKVGRGLFAAK